MHLPPDWDQPKEGNEALCKKFSYGTLKRDGLEVPYRYLRYPAAGVFPLVVYLHGADAVGDDNEKPLAMHDIGTVFATDEWQAAHPCHILAPQYHYRSHWSTDEMNEAVYDLVSQKAKEWRADRRRIYIYGYSAGGVGTLRYIQMHPGFYAAAISICGAPGRGHLENLAGIPLWLVHALDDKIVKATYDSGIGKLYHFGSRDLYDLIKDRAPALKYTELPAGYMKETYGVNPHCSWVEVSEHIEKYGGWLFSQERKTP